MRRASSTALAGALAALAGCIHTSRREPIQPDPLASDVPHAFLVRALQGAWHVEYDGGFVRTYVFQPNGTVEFVQEARRCTLVTRPELLLAFNDGKIERLRITGTDAFAVEHWSPGTGFPQDAPRKGIARRIRG